MLSPEVWWNEASYSRNVAIRGNTIRNVAYAPEQLGALVIANTEMPVQVCGHQDIVIQSNIFQQFVGPNVYLSSACNVAVMDNRFIRANDENTVIRLIGVNGVHFESNQIAASNAKRDKLIEETASTQVEGIEEGIKVCAQNHCG